MKQKTVKYLFHFFASFIFCSFLQGSQKPRFVVVIVIDQFAYELSTRYRSEWTGGLRTLFNEGVVFAEAYHSHAATETSPGHATLMSGRHPYRTGIVSNNWFSSDFKSVNSTDDDYATALDVPAGVKASSNGWFVGTSFGDWLVKHDPKARLVTLGGKARSAIFMAGSSNPDVYWFEPFVGFTTSTSYRLELPEWLREANKDWLKSIEQQEIIWSASKPKSSTFSDRTYLLDGNYLGQKTIKTGLPKMIKQDDAPLDRGFYQRFVATPFYDDLLLQYAKKIIEEEKLGQGDHLNILAVGLAANDYIGHSYGTGGPEMRDQLLRLDRALGSFIKFLQSRDPNVAIVLSSDHGAPDFSERLNEKKFISEREQGSIWLQAVNKRVRKELSKSEKNIVEPFLTIGGSPIDLYLNPMFLQGHTESRQDLMPKLLKILKEAPHVLEVYTREEVIQARPTPHKDPRTLTMVERFSLSTNKERSGDIFVRFKPYITWGMGGSQHGTPEKYDRHVPLIFWGPWKHQVISDAVETVDLAPTLAHVLGIKPTELVDGRVLTLLPKSKR